MTTSTQASTPANGHAGPSAAAIAALNKIRATHGVVSTEYSDVFAAAVNEDKGAGRFETLGQRALHIIGDSYHANNKLRWGATLKEEQIFTIPNWRYISDAGTVESRTRFAKAYRLIDACNFGMWGNAEYSDSGKIGGVAGGVDNFPIYPADMRYMADGDAELGLPGDGYDIALKTIRDAFTDRSTYFDYLNAASYELFTKGVMVEGKVVTGKYFMETVLPSLTSDEYQAYLRDVHENADKDVQEAARYFYTAEIHTIALLNRSTTSRIFIERQSAALSSMISDIYHGKKTFSLDTKFDTTVMPYVLTRMRLALSGSSNSLVKSAAAALQMILISLEIDKTQVAGLDNHAAVANLFRIYSGDACLGEAVDVVLDAHVVEEEVEKATSAGSLKFVDGSAKAKFVGAVKTLNTSGLLGSIGFLLSCTRAVYDTLYLDAAIQQNKVTTAQVLALISRYLGVYGGLGNCLKLFNALKPSCKKALLFAADTLRFSEISAAIWGPGGSIATTLSLPESTELVALNDAAADLAKNFAELPFAEETNFIDTFFASEVSTAARSVTGVAPEVAENIVTTSTAQVAGEIETVTANAISRSASETALKVFGLSTVTIGLIADIIGLASAIVDLAKTASPKATQIMGLTSAVVGISSSVIGVGVAYGFLEATAFPPLALGLGIVAIIVGLASAIVNLVQSNSKGVDAREKMVAAFKEFEKDGYMHEWGDKIQFLVAYYTFTRSNANGYKLTRWSPPDVAIFVDESAAWKVFQQTSGSTRDRFRQAGKQLVHATWSE